MYCYEAVLEIFWRPNIWTGGGGEGRRGEGGGEEGQRKGVRKGKREAEREAYNSIGEPYGPLLMYLNVLHAGGIPICFLYLAGGPHRRT